MSPVAAGRSLGQGLLRRPCGSIGRGIGRSETQKRTASGTWSVAPVGTSVGQSLGRERFREEREWFRGVGRFWPRLVGDSEANSVWTSVVQSLGHERRQDVGRFFSETELVERRQYVVQFIGRIASVANSVGMLETVWVNRCQDVGQSALGSLG